MPLIANNIIVGGVSSPTPEKKEPIRNAPSFRDVVAKAHRQNAVAQRQQNAPVELQRTAPSKERVIPDHYVVRNDGELVRHINTKSGYIRDIYEIE